MWFEARHYNSGQVFPLPAKLACSGPHRSGHEMWCGCEALVLRLDSEINLEDVFFGCLHQFTECIALFHEATNNFQYTD